MSRTIAVILLGTSAVLTSVATAIEVRNHTFKPADLEHKALVLLSTSSDRAAPSGLATALYLSIRTTKDKSQTPRFKHVWAISIDNSFTTSHSPTEHMSVHWLALVPGEYQLTQEIINSRYWCLPTYATFNFTVFAGQKLYLGEYRLDGHELLQRSAYARDLEIFTAKSKGEKPASFDAAIPAPTLKVDETCVREGRPPGR